MSHLFKGCLNCAGQLAPGTAPACQPLAPTGETPSPVQVSRRFEGGLITHPARGTTQNVVTPSLTRTSRPQNDCGCVAAVMLDSSSGSKGHTMGGGSTEAV